MRRPLFRSISKQLTCPRCGDVVADATYRNWPPDLVLRWGGSPVQPMGAALQIRLVEQQLAAAPPAEHEELEARLRFLERHSSDLIYRLQCPRGHVVVVTMPQIVREIRRAGGRWVSLPTGT